MVVLRVVAIPRVSHAALAELSPNLEFKKVHIAKGGKSIIANTHADL